MQKRRLLIVAFVVIIVASSLLAVYIRPDLLNLKGHMDAVLIKQESGDETSNQNLESSTTNKETELPTPTTTSIIVSPLLDQPTKRNGHPLISPDEEWLLSTLTIGTGPLSRYRNDYLELINLKGKANKYIYLDWFERGEGNLTELSPLGWSNDGKSLYLVSGAETPDESTSWEQVYGWIRGGGVARLDVDNPNSYPSNYINPYGGYYPPDKYGSLLDADPQVNLAVWFERPISSASGTARILTFPMQTYHPEEETKLLFELSTGTKAYITSASIDVDGKSVAFVVHEDGTLDQLWIKKFEADKAEQIPVDEALLKRIGITNPYVFSVQKTSMLFDASHGLFLTVRDAKGKKVFIRRLTFDGKTSWIQE